MISAYNQNLIEEVFRKARITGELSDASVYKYNDSIKRFFSVIGNKNISELTLKDFDDFVLRMKDNKVSNTRISNIISAMKRTIFELQRDGLISKKLDLNLLRKPKIQRKNVEYLTEEEVKRLIDTIYNYNHDKKINKARMMALIYLMLQTGARVGEALSINISDIDRQNLEIRIIGKGNKPGKLFLRKETIFWIDNYLKSRKDKNIYLFTAEGGNSRWAQTDVGRCFRRYLQSANINKKIVLHTLRHTYATHLFSRGLPLHEVQRLLRHSRPETTMRYYIAAAEEITLKKRVMDDKYFDFIPKSSIQFN